jgi:hypothetical protein
LILLLNHLPDRRTGIVASSFCCLTLTIKVTRFLLACSPPFSTPFSTLSPHRLPGPGRPKGYRRFLFSCFTLFSTTLNSPFLSFVLEVHLKFGFPAKSIHVLFLSFIVEVVNRKLRYQDRIIHIILILLALSLVLLFWLILAPIIVLPRIIDSYSPLVWVV